MFSLLKVPAEKISDKKISDAKYRVSQISKTFDQVAESLKDSLKLVFGCQTVPTTLKQSELESCKKIAKDKYSNPDWTLKR